MKTLLWALVAGSIAMTTVPVAADEYGQATFGEKWYLELKVGAPLPPTTKVDVNAAGLGGGTYDEDSGFAGAVTVGTYFAPRWRGELELSWTNADDGDVYLGGTKYPHSGDINIYTAAVNALYEFDSGWLKPFVGAGLGVSIFDVDDFGAVGGSFLVDDSDTAFVANVIAGAEYPLNETISLTGRYTAGVSTKATFDTTAAGVDVDKEAQFHNYLSFGVKINLN